MEPWHWQTNALEQPIIDFGAHSGNHIFHTSRTIIDAVAHLNVHDNVFQDFLNGFRNGGQTILVGDDVLFFVRYIEIVVFDGGIPANRKRKIKIGKFNQNI